MKTSVILCLYDFYIGTIRYYYFLPDTAPRPCIVQLPPSPLPRELHPSGRVLHMALQEDTRTRLVHLAGHHHLALVPDRDDWDWK